MTSSRNRDPAGCNRAGFQRARSRCCRRSRPVPRRCWCTCHDHRSSHLPPGRTRRWSSTRTEGAAGAGAAVVVGAAIVVAASVGAEAVVVGTAVVGASVGSGAGDAVVVGASTGSGGPGSVAFAVGGLAIDVVAARAPTTTSRQALRRPLTAREPAELDKSEPLPIKRISKLRARTEDGVTLEHAAQAQRRRVIERATPSSAERPAPYR